MNEYDIGDKLDVIELTKTNWASLNNIIPPILWSYFGLTINHFKK